MPSEENRTAGEAPSSKVMRNAFITTVVAIAMNPLSVVLGYYLNQRLQKPDMGIHYVSEIFIVEDHVLPSSIIASIRSDQGLQANLRDALTRLSSERSESPCVGWIDGEAWEDRCIPIVTESARGITNAITAHASAPAPRMTERLPPKTARAQVQKLESLLKELKKMNDNPKTPRTGEVSLTIGVLNAGDSDGVIFNRAKLRSQRKELWLWADTYTVVKSHSFQEIEFKVGKEEQDPDALKKWTQAVKDGVKIDYEVLLKVGNDAYIAKKSSLSAP